MSDKEVLEGAEKALDVIEKRLDNIEELENWYYFDKATKIKMGIGFGMILAGVAIAAGTTGWLLAKKKVTKEANEHLEKQIEYTKRHYTKMNKQGEFSTPQGAAAALGVVQSTPAVEIRAAEEAITRYQGKNEDSEIAEAADPEVKVEVNVFSKAMDESTWDQDKEEAFRKSLRPGEPYIISDEEFMSAEPGYNQVQLTYYTGDNVLADEKDEPIELIDQAVGEGNIRFGYGSGDSRTVFIRNDRLECDFEVSQSDGKFAHEVLGFQHSDEHGSRQRDRHERRNQNRKFRDGND